LVNKLELTENITLVHPFIKEFEKSVTCYSDQQVSDASKGIFSELSDTTQEIVKTVHTTTFYVGFAVQRAPIQAGRTARKLDISLPVGEFVKMCKAWEMFDQEHMDICVNHIKR
jgi:poly(A) polymerase